MPQHTKFKWQPIETAPMNGLWVYAVSHWNIYQRAAMHFDMGYWQDYKDTPVDLRDFTHWMPLPEPPDEI